MLNNNSTQIVNFLLETDLISVFFITCAFLVTITGILIYFKDKFVSISPVVIEAYSYGKWLPENVDSKFVPYIQVPKRWFTHFYVTSAIVSWTYIGLYFLSSSGIAECHLCQSVFNILTSANRKYFFSYGEGWLALLLYSFHVWKRLLESSSVSTYSDSKINVIHYLLGHAHYISAFSGLVSVFPGFVRTGRMVQTGVNFLQLLMATYVITCSICQYKCFKILANLREIKGGNKSKYLLPKGFLFEYISCPHMLLEILVYFFIAFLFRFRHYTWNCVTLFVFCNQIQIAIFNHKWYKENFKDYPKSRKAIIPFIL